LFINYILHSLLFAPGHISKEVQDSCGFRSLADEDPSESQDITNLTSNSGTHDRPASSSGNNLRGVKKDLMNMSEFIEQFSSKIDIGFEVLGSEMPKNIYIHTIEKTFNQKTYNNTYYSRYIIYYSGHGKQKTGDWATGDGFVTFNEVVTLWKKSPAFLSAAVLVIIVDACHSGVWVKEAAKLNDVSIAVQAACANSECSQDSSNGGVFTNHFLKLNNYSKNGVQKEITFHPCFWAGFGGNKLANRFIEIVDQFYLLSDDYFHPSARPILNIPAALKKY